MEKEGERRETRKTREKETRGEGRREDIDRKNINKFKKTIDKKQTVRQAV